MSDPLVITLASLPHSPDFRFVDRLLELDPGKSGVGEYRVPTDTPFLRSHFPNDPLMPGVLLIEAVAQLAGIVAPCDPEHEPLPELRLTSVRSVKLLGPARPGDRLELRAEVEARLDRLIQCRVSVGFEGRDLLTGTVTLSGARP